MQTAYASTESLWKQAFKDAVLELDPTRLQPKLTAAEAAIEDRLQKARSNGGTDHQELMELEDAKRTILFLRQEPEN
jgi:multidrug efflux pump subunit AcrA (membrane-fusion protein)